MQFNQSLGLKTPTPVRFRVPLVPPASQYKRVLREVPPTLREVPSSRMGVSSHRGLALLSDGEAFAEGVRRLGIGVVLGRRTWGGAIWLTGSNSLVDGGIATAAESGTGLTSLPSGCEFGYVTMSFETMQLRNSTRQNGVCDPRDKNMVP